MRPFSPCLRYSWFRPFFSRTAACWPWGCNIWNLGFYPCYIAYPFIFKPLAGDGGSPRRSLVAALAGVVIALQLGAFSVVMETILSGGSELPFKAFVLLMQPIHLAIGLVEGIITAGAIGYVKSARPEFLEQAGFLPEARPVPLRASMKKVLVPLVVLTIVSGTGLSWFASTHPDGLEWSIERVAGKSELTGEDGAIRRVLKKIQEKTAFLPDYDFRGEGKEGEPSSWPAVEAGRSVSGIVGSSIVLGMVLLIGFGIRTFKKRFER